LPTLGSWSLAEIAAAPAAVRDWHAKVKHPVSGNRCAALLSATFRYASRLDRSLPPVNVISAVRLNAETPKQSAMPFADFPKWNAAVESLPAIRAAFYKFVLLTGMRSGEAARLKWSDIDVPTRSITLPKAKAGADIVIPLSAALARELKRARRGDGDGVIFPNVKNWNDALDFKGHALRHTWRSVAADLGVDELQARLLLGHSLVGISQSYVTRAVLSGGPGLRAAQRIVSRRIVELLKSP
jgi:integrase